MSSQRQKSSDVKFSKAQKQTETEAFKRWFGDSKVVNEDGTPKVMYHGTDESFTVFDTILNPSSVAVESDKSGTDFLIFHKEIGNKITAVTVVSNKKRALTLKTAWITKKQHISLPSDVQAPNPTPKAMQSMNAVSNNSIPQNSDLSTHARQKIKTSPFQKFLKGARGKLFAKSFPRGLLFF